MVCFISATHPAYLVVPGLLFSLIKFLECKAAHSLPSALLSSIKFLIFHTLPHIPFHGMVLGHENCSLSLLNHLATSFSQSLSLFSFFFHCISAVS